MRNTILTLILGILLNGFKVFAQSSYTDFVNPFIGTGGHGHTFPGAVMPFGMVQLSPDTRIDGSWEGCSGYHYSDSIIYGFSHTHLSGTGVSDYGDILLMPVSKKKIDLITADASSWKNQPWKSHFSHRNETASPGYYSVHLDDENIEVELTVTERAGFHKYTFPEGSKQYLILDLAHRDKVIESSFNIIGRNRIEGMRRSEGWAKNQVVYFYMEFSKPFEESYHAYLETRNWTSHEQKGTDLKTWFQFDSTDTRPLYIKVGISQVSAEGARKNLEEDIAQWDFEKIKMDAAVTWNKELSKIEVSGGTEEQKRIFYTALYHCMIHPSLANDVDGKYLGRDFKVHQLPPNQNYYTVFSLWDTYRALHPLLTIIDSARTVDFIRTFLLQYEQGGRLPVWELSSNETECMIGYHSVSVIADAAMKGIKGFDYDLALKAMKHSANLDHFGLKAYKERGYISMEDEGESVSKTLEYTYDDWCIAWMSSLVNNKKDSKLYSKRAQYWKNIFDYRTGFMRPRRNGNFYSPFNPYEVNFNYTEANAWQYSFSAPQDIGNLIMAHGGSKYFEARLDSLFTTTSKISGREQPDISGMIGQYAHGNEPSHHIAYLYNYVGMPWKTQQMTRKIMQEFYHDDPDGLSGNEDCGQMSAWYVFSAMGFYPVSPGAHEYSIGSPLFDSIKIHLDNGKTFSIIAHNNSAENIFIQSKNINGEIKDSLFISHIWIRKGLTLSFEMNSQHSLLRQNSQASQFDRILRHPIVSTPLIVADNPYFYDKMTISITTHDNESKLYYSVNDSSGNYWNNYVHPFIIDTHSVIKAIAVFGKDSSKVVTASFRKTTKDYKVTYLTEHNSQYAGSGNMTLVDEESGTTNFRNGLWQGWWGENMEIVVDLGKATSVSKVGAEFLQDQVPWIFFPRKLQVQFSSDGINFSNDRSVTTSATLLGQNEEVQTALIQIPVSNVKARYLKIIAHNYGKLPSWHLSAGGNSWIFCDEIFVE